MVTPKIDADWKRFEALYDAEVDLVYGFLIARCGDAVLAEDLTAETFAAAVRHYRGGRADEVTGGWLTTVARRRLVDHWRNADARRRRLVRMKSERVVDPVSHDLDDDVVLDALSTLPERQRIALGLRYLDDLAVSEVAEAMGLPYGTTESLLARARRSFSTAYEEMT